MRPRGVVLMGRIWRFVPVSSYSAGSFIIPHSFLPTSLERCRIVDGSLSPQVNQRPEGMVMLRRTRCRTAGHVGSINTWQPTLVLPLDPEAKGNPVPRGCDTCTILAILRLLPGCRDRWHSSALPRPWRMHFLHAQTCWDWRRLEEGRPVLLLLQQESMWASPEATRREVHGTRRHVAGIAAHCIL